MSLSKKDILEYIILEYLYQLTDDTIITFNTIDQRQTFIATPKCYKTFKVCIFESINDAYTICDNCNLLFTKKEDFAKINKYYLKIVERYGTDYSTPLFPTNTPIDLNSVRLIKDYEFDDIVKDEVKKRRILKKEMQKQAIARQKYAEIERAMTSLIEADLTVFAKVVSYTDPALGSNASYDAFYSYNKKNIVEKLDFFDLMTVFNTCIEHYGFSENPDIVQAFNSCQESLTKTLQNKKYQNIDETLTYQKRLANILGERYLAFLKFLFSNGIDPSNDDYRYVRTWKEYGFGNDRDYVLTVTEPVYSVFMGICVYIARVLSLEDGLNFKNEVYDIIASNKNNKKPEM